MGYKPTNKYLPPRPRTDCSQTKQLDIDPEISNPLLRWADRFLAR